ncbi:MAG: 5'-methylthioadenosine/adenosylhomocysteine nucleosidase [Comamonas sp.]
MTLAILSALPQEQDGLVQAMAGAQAVAHAGRQFWRGRLHGHDVVCALSGIGKVAAATTTAALIERFGVRRIVFTGVAGGVGEGVQVGDVVIASDYLQHDLDASPLFPRWEMPGYGRTRLACDAAMAAALLQAARACVEGDTEALRARHATHPPRAHCGLIASGDQFVGTAAASRALAQGLRTAGHEVLAVEMEGAAVAQACLDYGVPFAAMRTISDRADDSAHVDFAEFVRSVASRYAQRIIGGFLQGLPPH